jgi:hypothetical protein
MTESGAQKAEELFQQHFVLKLSTSYCEPN